MSFTNLLSLLTGSSFTTSSEDVLYLGANVRKPERPFLPWRTTALGDQGITVDFGQGRQIALVVLVNCNFTSARIEGTNNNAEWAGAPFSQTVTIARNPRMWRYQHGVIVTGFAYRYMRIMIPDQTPVDGATYYSLGGLWAGTIATMPRPWRWEVEYQTIEPREDAQPRHAGWRQRLALGEPFVRMIVRTHSRVNEAHPAQDDQFEQWSDLERQVHVSDFFVPVNEINGTYDTSQVLVVRRVNQSQWTSAGLGMLESTWELEEVTGGT